MQVQLGPQWRDLITEDEHATNAQGPEAPPKVAIPILRGGLLPGWHTSEAGEALTPPLLAYLNSDQNTAYIPASRSLSVLMGRVLLDAYAALDRRLYRNPNSIEPDDFGDDNTLLMHRFLQKAEYMKHRFQYEGGFESRTGFADAWDTLPAPAREASLQSLAQRAQTLLKGTYHNESSGEYLHLHGGERVPMANAASGQQEAIRILQDASLTIRQGWPAFRVYEEIEAHLHPRAQQTLMEAVAIMLQANPRSQALMPTHSPYVLLAADNLIRAAELAHERPDLSHAITQLGLPPACRIRFEHVSAWHIEQGEFTHARSHDRKGIKADYVDQPAVDMEAVFDQLLELSTRP